MRRIPSVSSTTAKVLNSDHNEITFGKIRIIDGVFIVDNHTAQDFQFFLDNKVGEAFVLHNRGD